ncbi:MAG: TonB-dependent receptor domain-containing protein [Allosphingosinicella sp.]|uniref:TonB-dependent receptor domain-containing protein n=1 Tax=Allosphingosinicella sp. TaxID=2823234 RepID=UPI0039340C45
MTTRTMLLAAVSVGALAAPPLAAQVQNRAEQQEIVVTAIPLSQTVEEVAVPVTVLDGEDLVYRRQATIGETLANEPGIRADTFGGGAARPVVRGQTSPRIRILSDGAQIQDASDVSPDHAIAAEPLLLRRIEVLRGPAALLYGGGAISGAVNLLDTKIPETLPIGGFDGVAELRAGTSDRERTAVGGVTVGLGPLALRAEGVYRNADDYRVPDWDERRVDGTFNRTRTGTVGASWVGTDGFFGIAYTHQRSRYGVPGHSHDYESCHPHGTRLHCGGHGHGHDDHDHHDEDDHEDVFINLRSDRVDVRGEYRNPVAGIERIRLRGGFTDYRHDEIEGGGDHDDHGHGHGHGHGHDHDEDEAVTSFKNRGHDMRLEVEHAPIFGMRGVIGIQNSRNRLRTSGPEAFIPENVTRNTGIFLLETFETGPLRLEIGARQEWQRITATNNREARHSPFSISGAGILTLAPGYSAALSLARAQRAPTGQELFARGVHLATNTFEIGNPGLRKETANSIDLTFRGTEGPTTFSIGLFRNHIDDYIFANTLDRFEDFRLIRYDQRDARFAGVEGMVRHQITPEIGIGLFGDYVRARFTGGGDDLPRIPAGRLGTRLDVRSGPLFGDVELYRVFEQDRIADFETETPGYTMLNATLAYRLPVGQFGQSELFLRGTNLLNELAFNHVSFVKEAAPLRGRNLVVGLRTTF